MYNPEELKLEQGNNFAEVGIPGLNAPPLQYVRGKARSSPMELFFDTYETGQDVRDFTAPIVRLLDKQPHDHGPAGAAVLAGPDPVPLRPGRRRAAVHHVPAATARRCARPCRCGCRSTCEVDLEIQQGLFFGSPTVSAAVNTVAGSVTQAVSAVLTGAATVTSSAGATR